MSRCPCVRDKEDDEKEGYHLTTRRNYNFVSGAFESDYASRDEQIKAMTLLMEKQMPGQVEDKAISTKNMDDYTKTAKEPIADETDNAPTE